MKKNFNSVAGHLVLIALTGLAVYSNTLNVPFQWDEATFITENPVVKDISYFLQPSKAEGLEMSGTLKVRYAGYLSFALNHMLHGFDVTGYHAANITIHILNALLVYCLAILTFSTPLLEGSAIRKDSRHIALFTGLFFVSHPVQTEAVTYIFQRLTSLAAMFYLLSVVIFIRWRLLKERQKTRTEELKQTQTINAKAFILYCASLFSAFIAMKTKEISFTLPAVVMLYEFFFLGGSLRQRLPGLAPFFLLLFVVPFAWLESGKSGADIIKGLAALTRGFEGISRQDYFFTQLRVIVTYIRLLFLPVNQNIYYDYPLFRSFFDPRIISSFLFLLSLTAAGIYIFYRSLYSDSSLRVTAFGIFWFFIVISVESSLIPIPMLINEYRVYLPSAGAFMALVTGTFLFMERLKSRRARNAVIVLLILAVSVFSSAAHARNRAWESGVSLWKDTVKKSPGKAKAHYNLGCAYLDRGLIDKAIESYLAALQLNPGDAESHNNIGNAYVSKGSTDKAMEHFKTAIRLTPDSANAHNNLGSLYLSGGQPDKAIEHLGTAIRLSPDFTEAHFNTGNAFRAKYLYEEALGHYQTALRLNPSLTKAHYHAGLVYLEKNELEQARKEFEAALRQVPDDKDTEFFLEYIRRSGIP